jgi:hypothetical protein
MRLLAGGAGVAIGTYAACVGVAWFRFGNASPISTDDRDDVLDRFMPVYDVVERHRVRIAAPAAITLTAAKEHDLREPRLIRAIFKVREVALGATPDDHRAPTGLLAEALSLGWGILAESPAHEVVVGAITKPWEANVTFHAVAPDQFEPFWQRGYVKIAWNLRVDAVGESDAIFRTETRAIAMGAVARAKFRRYWAFASPGVSLIRSLSLVSLKRDAERRADVASSLW